MFCPVSRGLQSPVSKSFFSRFRMWRLSIVTVLKHLILCVGGTDMVRWMDQNDKDRKLLAQHEGPRSRGRCRIWNTLETGYLIYLNLRFFETHKESFSLCYVELSGCNLGDEGFQLLAEHQEVILEGLLVTPKCSWFHIPSFWWKPGRWFDVLKTTSIYIFKCIWLHLWSRANEQTTQVPIMGSLRFLGSDVFMVLVTCSIQRSWMGEAKVFY